MTKMQQIISTKQIQELALKPKMLQSLQMLALPLIELEMQIKRELELNPILELEDDEDDKLAPNGQEEDLPNAEDLPTKDDTKDEELTFEHIEEIKELSDIIDAWNDYQKEGKEYYEGDDRNAYDTFNSEKYDEYVKDKKSSFTFQLEMLTLTEEEHLFAKDLLDSVDNFGYLLQDFDIYDLGSEYLQGRITKEQKKIEKILPETIRRVDEIHQMIMKLKPQGITARSVPECLIAQLETDDLDYDILIILLTNYFEDLIHRRYTNIAAKLSLTLQKVHQLKSKIALLNPKPGLHLLTSPSDYVIPDVIIKKIEDDYVVLVNDYNTPHLTISRNYKSMLMSGKLRDRQTLSFIKDKINSAKFVIKSIYMRNRTIKRVVWSIIKHQRGFFYTGTGVFEPLTYSIIAQDLNICESTVSRVVRNKYADTPYGVIPLKDFFTSTAGKTDNYEDVSRHNVQKHIINIISNEDKIHPVSDLDIAEELRGININVSRRVIAKYREGLGILNSRLRRLEK